jgi:hypothetical protein
MESTAQDIATVWGLSLVIGLAVILVVAFLLHRIWRTGQAIEAVAADIWTQGKLVANNTIQIPLFLSTTNRVLSRIHKAATGIVGASKAIEQHAEGCPGCPDCVLDLKK